MKRWIFPCSIILFIFACQTQPSVKVLTDPLIVGKATPIQLGLETTVIPVADYILDPNRLDSVTSDGPFYIDIDNSNVVLRGRPKKPLYNLTFWSDGVGESVLLKRTKKSLYSFLYQGEAKEVKIKGEFNAWNPNNNKLEKNGDVFSGYVLLSPGNYQYLFVVDGKEIRDPLNKDSVSNGMGGWNSVIDLPRADREELPILKTSSYSGNSFVLTSSNNITNVYAYWGNTLLDENFISVVDSTVSVTIPSNAGEMQRSSIRVWAENQVGVSNDVLIPLHEGKVLNNSDLLTRKDRESLIMYFLIVDRFHNGNESNDKPLNIPEVHPKADYFGGDFAGVTQKIEDGYFESLGVNTIWLSPITQNPEGNFGKYPEPETSFSAYHGYWPISNTKVDYRFGSDQEFRDLVQKAHGSEMNVLLDYVANHVHEQHPIYQNNPDWATDLYLPDGTLNTEKWDEHRLTTWFDTFLPTLDLSKMETVDPLTDSALFWLREYEIDGFRHDATKHIPLIFWRVLTKKIKQQKAVDQEVFQIGETYGSHELIKSYINTGMLDAQFDFNMYDRAVAAFAQEDGSLESLATALGESIRYYGDHNLMGYITGNQDRPRFISFADGSLEFGEDTKYAGWNREITIQDTTAYRKLSALTAYMMTIPGIPCIYYGDEYGSPGGNDPDNRRQMKFEDLDKHQLATRERAMKMIQLRKSNLALIYGDTEIIESDSDFLMIKRSYFDNTVIAVFNTSDAETFVEVLPGGKNHFFGSLSGTSLGLPANSYDIITYSN